jgi:hypothetical protein
LEQLSAEERKERVDLAETLQETIEALQLEIETDEKNVFFKFSILLELLLYYYDVYFLLSLS